MSHPPGAEEPPDDNTAPIPPQPPWGSDPSSGGPAYPPPGYPGYSAYPGYPGYPPGYSTGPQGAPYHPAAPYGIHPTTGLPYSDKSKLVAGLLQLLLPLGIGRMYMGHTGMGVAQLLVTVFTCGLGALCRSSTGSSSWSPTRPTPKVGSCAPDRPGHAPTSGEVTKSMSSSTRPSNAGSRSL